MGHQVERRNKKADDSSDDGEEEKPMIKVKISEAIASKIIDDDVPQAFSHWTYVWTKHDRLVCDLQGVLEKNVFVMTDPAIHSRTWPSFGPTDRGNSG